MFFDIKIYFLPRHFNSFIIKLKTIEILFPSFNLLLSKIGNFEFHLSIKWNFILYFIITMINSDFLLVMYFRNQKVEYKKVSVPLKVFWNPVVKRVYWHARVNKFNFFECCFNIIRYRNLFILNVLKIIFVSWKCWINKAYKLCLITF